MQRQRREQVLSQQHLCAGNFTTLAKNKTSLLLRSTQAMLQIIRSRYVQCACEQRSLLRRQLHQDLKSSSKGNEGVDEVEQEQQRGRRRVNFELPVLLHVSKSFPFLKWGGSEGRQALQSARTSPTLGTHNLAATRQGAREGGARGTNIYISNTKF